MNIYDSLRSRPLRRTPDKLLGGLCSGLAHRWGISPVLVRIGMILLMLVGGLGLVVYGLGWLFVPDYETDEIVAEGALRNPDAAMAAAVILILVGAAVFIPFAGAWIFAALDRAPFVLVIIGIVVVFAFLVSRQRRERKEYTLSPTLVGPLPQPEELAPQTTPMPRPIKAPRTKKPALSARAIYLFLAAALIGVALALLLTPGKVASILMAFAVGLAVVAAGVIYAGIRGLRATWLTALTWILALQTACALALAMAMPTSMIQSPTLNIFSSRTDSSPSVFATHVPTINSAADAHNLHHVDTLVLAGNPSKIREDAPVIFEITRREGAWGDSWIHLSGYQPWDISTRDQKWQLPLTDGKANKEPEQWWHTVPIERGQTIRIASPAAASSPSTAKIVKITYSYGTMTIRGKAADKKDDQQAKPADTNHEPASLIPEPQTSPSLASEGEK
ncbi:PspC domain-containing protein [Trueperella pyogenes]|uniref:PspC domain-containing protein n=1 Tax=Trueperella pyogenes TaxID=1661 RepID=UPI00345D1A3E